jgi:sugar phosphate isomerase/epimerase
MSRLAISTSWNADRHISGREMIKELIPLGFDDFELSFSLPKEILDEIFLLKNRGNFKVISLHNYCPLPDGLDRYSTFPDCFSLASQDESLRKKAIAFTKASIDTAKRFGATVLVLHCGRVEIDSATKVLMRLYEEGRKDSAEYKDTKDELIEQRERNKQPFLEKSLESLDEISKYAAAVGISLGIENRIYYREIPSFDELEIILDKFSERNVGYWHDVGHAQVLENLGFTRHQEYLEKYAQRMIGIHLHDVNGIKDHRAPLKGVLDFKMIVPYLKRDCLKVLEVHYPASAKDIIKAKEYLTELFSGAL